jgi:hypothetical protein
MVEEGKVWRETGVQKGKMSLERVRQGVAPPPWMKLHCSLSSLLLLSLVSGMEKWFAM